MTRAFASTTAGPAELSARIGPGAGAAKSDHLAGMLRPGHWSRRREAREQERLYAVAICFVTLIGLGLRLAFANGPVGSDDTLYFDAARWIVHGDRIPKLDHAYSRLILLLVVGGPGALAGSMYVCGVINIFVSTTAQIVTSIFAYRAVSARAGLITAIVLAFDGLSISYSGGLWPDDLLSLASVLCAIAVFRAVRSDPSRSVRMTALAGLAAGVAYSVKDTGILLIPPVVLFIAMWGGFSLRRRAGLLATFLLFFAGLWAAEGVFYLARAGDFFYRVHAIARVHNASIVPASGVKDFLHRGYWNLASTAYSVWMMALPLLIGSVCWLALLRRRDETTVFGLIGGFVAFYLFFGTSSLVRLVNLPFQERYFIPLVPFIVLSFVILLERVAAPVRREAMALVALGVVCLAGGVAEASTRSGTLYFTEGLRNAALAARQIPKDGRPIYATDLTRVGLEAYVPPETFVRLRSWSGAGSPPGYYISLYREGQPIWPDSTIPDPRALGPTYVSVGVSQRRASAWFAVPRRTPRDSAVVFSVGNR
jgi:hypothetical protein